MCVFLSVCWSVCESTNVHLLSRQWQPVFCDVNIFPFLFHAAVAVESCFSFVWRSNGFKCAWDDSYSFLHSFVNLNLSLPSLREPCLSSTYNNYLDFWCLLFWCYGQSRSGSFSNINSVVAQLDLFSTSWFITANVLIHLSGVEQFAWWSYFTPLTQSSE